MTENEIVDILMTHFEFLKHSWKPYPDGKVLDALRESVRNAKEIQRYRSIGTIEECKEATKKQQVMKPKLNDMETICPECGYSLKRCYWFCPVCGQAISWLEKMGENNIRQQNCSEDKFCKYCKYCKDESEQEGYEAHICRNEHSELFGKNLTPFQTCRYFLKNSESYYNDGWILCKERLPEIGRPVLVCDKQGNVCVREITCEIKGKKYWSQNKNDVVAWQPLPEPFNEKCKNQNGGIKNE